MKYIISISIIFLLFESKAYAQLTSSEQPEEFGLKIFELVQYGKWKNLKYSFLSQEEFGHMVTKDEEMKLKGVEPSPEQRNLLYTKLERDFSEKLDSRIKDQQRSKNFRHAKADSITYDLIIPHFEAPDEEFLWPQSKGHKIDLAVVNMARITVWFRSKKETHVLKIEAIYILGKWKFLDGIPYVDEL